MSECQFIPMPISLDDVEMRELGNGLQEIRYKSLFKGADGAEKIGEVVLQNLHYNPKNNICDFRCDENENVIFTFTIDVTDERTDD